MGLDNRDYLRDEERRYSPQFSMGGGGGGFMPDAPMAKKLLIFTLIVFLAQMLTTSNSKSVVTDWLQLDTTKVISGQVWRLVTYAFLHSLEDPMHIVFNMLFLFSFGPRIESLYGSKEFLYFYLFSAIIAAVAFVGLDLVTGSPGAAIGASGSIMALITVCAFHYPTQKIYLFLILPITLPWFVVIYGIYDLIPVLGALTGNGSVMDNVAHSAHLGGLAYGYFYARKQWRIHPWFAGISTWFRAKNRGLKVVRPSISDDDYHEKPQTSQLERQMDAILQKISEHGEESLTRSERKTLEKASRQLRDRRDR
tara:strand:+ start:263 stop:1192 length:930 start_codon:yes stop_codon:yes gene_type:complete